MKKNILVLSFFTIVIITIFIFSFHQKEIESRLNFITEKYTKTYEIIYNQKKQFSEHIRLGLIEKVNLAENLEKVSTATKEEKEFIRSEIYRKLQDRYDRLKKIGVKHIHIHLPDNTSFLRMHRPTKFGDDLTKIRPSVVYVNRYKKPMDTFEEGTVCYGLRFVYPVFTNQNTHVGSLEISFDALSITSSIMNQYQVLSNFFIKQSVALKKNFKDIQRKYVESHHTGYYNDTDVLKELTKVSQKNFKDLKPNNELLTQLRQMGQQQKPSSLYDTSTCRIFTIIPIINKITQENIGFLSIRSESENIILSSKYLILIWVLSILFIILFYSLIYMVLQKKEQEKLNIEQSKQIQLGELIANISHQWRQPLSVISTAASSIQVQKELNILKDEDHKKLLDKILDNTQYLSEVIDTFRDYIIIKKEKKRVVLQDQINLGINIVASTITNNNIEIINNVNNHKPIKISLVMGELSQVIINILTNAKDILLRNKIEHPFIKIDLEVQKDTILIIIEDNGGGIPTLIRSKIFDPYFTTKHRSIGTGLGLYMSKKTIEENLEGKLYFENTEEGVKFIIALPIN